MTYDGPGCMLYIQITLIIGVKFSRWVWWVGGSSHPPKPHPTHQNTYLRALASPVTNQRAMRRMVSVADIIILASEQSRDITFTAPACALISDHRYKPQPIHRITRYKPLNRKLLDRDDFLLSDQNIAKKLDYLPEAKI